MVLPGKWLNHHDNFSERNYVPGTLELHHVREKDYLAFPLIKPLYFLRKKQNQKYKAVWWRNNSLSRKEVTIQIGSFETRAHCANFDPIRPWRNFRSHY